MDYPRQECWSGLPCPPPGDLPKPGIETGSPALQVDSLLSEPPGKDLGGEKIRKANAIAILRVWASNRAVDWPESFDSQIKN